MIARIILLFCLVSIAMVGCGGGGAAGGSDENSTAIAITTTNQRAVAAAAVDADIRYFSNAGTNQVVAVTPTQGERSKVAFLRHLRWAALQVAPSASAEFPAATVPVSETIQCVSGDTSSGTLAINYNDNGDDEVSAGDSAAITLNNCLQTSSNERLNGTISFAFTNVSGTPASGTSGWSFTANVAMSSFSITANNGSGETTTANGSFTLTFTQNTLTQTTTTIIGASFAVRDSAGQVRWTNFSFTFVENSSTGRYTENGFGTLSTDALSGRITVTLTNLGGFDPDLPTSGRIEIDGASSSLILLPFNDGVNVTFNLDLGDDGTTDASTVIPWSTFL